MRENRVGGRDSLGFEVFIQPTEIESFYGNIFITHIRYPLSCTANHTTNEFDH